MMGTKEKQDVDLNMFPRLGIGLETNRARYVLGQVIGISGLVLRRTTPIAVEIKVKIEKDGETLFDESTESNDKGSFGISYHSTTIDPTGEWTVTASAEDELGNYETVEKKMGIYGFQSSNFLLIEPAAPIVGSYKRGSELRITMNVYDANLSAVSGSIVELIASNGDVAELNEISIGQYSGSYTIPWALGLGEQRFEVRASKSLQNMNQEGTTTFSVPIEEAGFVTELIEPKQTTASVGDDIVFKVRMSYASGEPVTESVLEAVINGQTVEMFPVEDGVYSTTYYVGNPATEKVEFSLNALDVYENFSEENVEIAVSGTSINYYARSFPVPFYLIAFAVVMAGVLVLFLRLEGHSLKSLKKKEGELLAQKRDIETRYFKRHTIDRKTFNKMKTEIGPALTTVRDEISKVENKINKRKETFQRAKK